MTTKYKPYAAFGTAIIRCNSEKGDVRKVNIGNNGLVTSGYYFYTQGQSQLRIQETGEIMEDRTPGWLNLEHPDSFAKTLATQNASGTLELTSVTDTEWFCISHEANKDGLPNLKSIILNVLESTEFKNDSNIFLARGTLQVKDKEFKGPCQIRVRSGDVTATNRSTETAYALLVS